VPRLPIHSGRRNARARPWGSTDWRASTEDRDHAPIRIICTICRIPAFVCSTPINRINRKPLHDNFAHMEHLGPAIFRFSASFAQSAKSPVPVDLHLWQNAPQPILEKSAFFVSRLTSHEPLPPPPHPPPHQRHATPPSPWNVHCSMLSVE
jgi:hypothetical protein